MTWNTHVLGGVIAGTAGAIALKTPIPMSVVAIAAVSAVIPDIDIPGSKITKIRGLKWISRPLSILINKLGGHRGVFHTPILYVVLSILLMLLHVPMFLVQGFLLGTLSHILLDALNPAGVPLFWPLSKKRVHIGNIKTGSFGESIVHICLAILWCIVCFLVIFDKI